MTDQHDDLKRAGEYDDDRLLALALGLEEDPELLAAAEADAELGARLAAARAGVAAVGAQVSAAVPEPEKGYTDLSGERWSGLKEFFEPPAETARPRRGRRWWRVVAPVAALAVLALFVGIIAVNGGSGSGSSSTGVASRSTDDAGSQENAGTGASGKNVQAPEATERATLIDRFTDELDRFAVVVLARARTVTGAMQRFAVLRVFKGSAPKVVELAVDGRPADTGRLHLLMLEPTAAPQAQGETPWPLTESPAAEGVSPLPDTVSPLPTESPLPGTASPGPVASLAGDIGEELAVSYTYDGAPTVVREFPAGTDPASIHISVP